jgi:hypothetical protein
MIESRRANVKDVTEIFDHYRISTRAIWNTAFWPDPDFRNWDSVDVFRNIRRILFDELVLAKIGREHARQDIFEVPIPFFLLMPASQTVPILIQNPRSPSQTGYWDHPVSHVDRGESEMHFISYFDWNDMDYVDLRYYLVRIAKFELHPEIVGRSALIETQHARVNLLEEGSTS